MSYDKSKSFKKLRGIIKRTHNELQDSIIVKHKNSYRAYSEYNITQKGPYWHVTTDFYDDPKVFNVVRAALAWCIAYKTSRYELASTIIALDIRLQAKQNDIDYILSRMDQQTIDPDLKFILRCRLSEDIHNRQSYKEQLTNCVNVTKYIQIKGIHKNELRRFTKAG